MRDKRSSRAASTLLSMLLINMTIVKAPMNGLSSGQATTSRSKKRPEQLDRPARAVIFENARAPTKNHAKTLGWVELPQEATKETRPSPCRSPKHGEGKQDLPQLELGQRGYHLMRPTHPMKITGVWENAEGSKPTSHLDMTCYREDISSNRPAAGQMLESDDCSGKRTGVRSRVSWRKPETSKT